jgi:hypothetical protein
MYVEFILIIFIFLVIYFIYFNDTRVNFQSTSGNYYLIQNNGTPEFKKQKADYLEKLHNKAKTIVEHMKNERLPTKEISEKTYNRFKDSKLQEIPENEKSAAYTINKGNISICIFKNGKFTNENDAYFVLLHELAHVMSDSYGHGDEFKKNFNFIVKLAVKLNLWKQEEAQYEKKPINYCGTKVTSTPCSNGVCTKDNIEHFYKQSLLEY